MNAINPRKLLHSKWTAQRPQHREKHFLVTELEFDEEGVVIHCLLEAVLSKRSQGIDWRSLQDEEQWRFGWH
jgi:tryptophan-rich hypothetical protein